MMRYAGCLLTLPDSLALIDAVDHWCLRTGTNYNKLVTAAGVGCTTRHKVRIKGQRITFTVAARLSAAMKQYPLGIPRDQHKLRIATIRRTRVQSSSVVMIDLESRRVNREPCSRCGIRADIGCKHSVVWSAGAVAGRAG